MNQLFEINIIRLFLAALICKFYHILDMLRDIQERSKTRDVLLCCGLHNIKYEKDVIGSF